jgi:transposase-like protein
MYDFDCPHCSWGMNRDDINNQVHENDHIGEWDVQCNNCKKTFELKAEESINYWASTEEAQEQGHDS